MVLVLSKEKFISPFLRHQLINFSEYTRDQILDIIYNSQLNEFVIKKFEKIREHENWVKAHKMQKMLRVRSTQEGQEDSTGQNMDSLALKGEI